ncbi:MAG: peptidoglycan-binding protein [Methylorubrum rhodinum]|uniref:peptidoglycan-binding protein n=1 Tax=Methylorubrum rhodinum TaxID=29428 RepID=UPI003BAEBF9A
MDVAEIQRALIARGYDLGTGGPSGKGDDGKAGARTQKAIKAFQVANGLTPDGKVGENTKAALFPDAVPARDDALPTFPPSGGEPPRGAGNAPVWPRQRDCMAFYGGVGLHQTQLVLPFPMRLAWDKKVVVNRISIHEKVHDSAARAFDRIAAAYDEAARKKLGLDLFGGSLNVRKMRGGSSYSMHSWGIAIDFDPERNQLKWGRDKARLAQPDAEEFWRIWEAEGWVSLGRARNMDWMHVQAARL